MNRFELCSQALILIGANPITSFEDDLDEAVVASNLWDMTVRSMFGYRWRFAVQQRALSREAGTPNAPYTASYVIPSDAETIVAVRSNDDLLDFNVYQQSILCNATADETVIADCVVIPSEEYWPGWFQSLMSVRLAASFAIPITEDTVKAQYYEGKFMRDLSQARLIDSQGATTRKMPVGGLRRFHGGRP